MEIYYENWRIAPGAVLGFILSENFTRNWPRSLDTLGHKSATSTGYHIG